MLRRLLLVCVLGLGLSSLGPISAGFAPADATAAPKAKAKSASARHNTASKRRGKNKKTAKVKLCSAKGSGKKAKRSCSFVKEFQGHGVAKSTLRADPLTPPSGAIWVRAANSGEEARVNIYKEDGTIDESALAALDEVFRCRRTGEVRAVDPRLYEQLSRIYDHFGGRQIELVSGFRFAERNSSRHYHASAMDIRITGISIKEMYSLAQSLDVGGMGIGIYPRSGFIHVDYRAPGEASYRWTDYSGPGSGKGQRSRNTGRVARARKPTS